MPVYKGAALAGLVLLCLAAGAARAQPLPFYYKCDSLASPRIGPESSQVAPLPSEIGPRLAEARTACEDAIRERPTFARMHGLLARVRLLSGDAPGALEAARKGAELGSSNAQVLLGVFLAEGEHAPRDHAAARELFQRAAKAIGPSPHALFNLGVMAANGWGAAQSDAEAAEFFRQAARQKDSLAMQLLGQRFDAARAEDWLRQAAEALSLEGFAEPLRLRRPGRAALDGDALAAWYRAKGEAGEPWAQTYLGLLHEHGLWVKQDAAAAAAWYRRAAAAGEVMAEQRLVVLYREGRGVPKDEAESRRIADQWRVRHCADQERAEAGANACDLLAADRHDPQRVTAGAQAFCLTLAADRAIAACRAAAKQSPGTARYRSQLARALAHKGQFAEARREAAAAAAAGSGSAMVLLGVMNQRGLGGPADESAARGWYRKAGEAGNPRGMSLSGMPIHYTAPTTAALAEKGDARAQHNQAALLEQQKKHEEAFRLYERAAAQGFRPSELNLAQMYEKGMGVAQDLAEARRRYRLLAEKGEGEARYRAAKLAAEAGDYAEALQRYERLAAENELRSLLDLGQMHEDGRGVSKDTKRAAALYLRAADRSPWARFKLGVMHLEGIGVPRDYARAADWLRRSAADGNFGARNNLGWMAEKGLGMKVDFAAARAHYLSGAVGSAEARGNLEAFFAAGLGAPAGGTAAYEWYLPGAEAGIPSAQYRVGRMLARVEGVARDDQAALRWLLKATDQGHVEARREAGDLLFRMGKMQEAALHGNPVALAALAASTPAGPAIALRIQAEASRPIPKPNWPQGIARHPGEDHMRKFALRVAAVPIPQAAAGDAGIANLYDIIPWVPEIDGRKK